MDVKGVVGEDTEGNEKHSTEDLWLHWGLIQMI